MALLLRDDFRISVLLVRSELLLFRLDLSGGAGTFSGMTGQFRFHTTGGGGFGGGGQSAAESTISPRTNKRFISKHIDRAP